MVKEQILENDRRILANARETELGRRLMEKPGVGPLLASAIVATVPDPAIFHSGRNLAAWIGLVPRQNSSGDKERLGGITKAGTNICARCSLSAQWRWYATPEATGTSDPNWCGCSPAAKRRSQWLRCRAWWSSVHAKATAGLDSDLC
jgi:transposase